MITFLGTLQMISYNFNPYVTHNSSSRIGSKVVSLVLKDDSGRALDTKDLPSDIEIDVPIPAYHPSNTTRSDNFLSPGSMQYHVITVREVNTTMKLSLTTKTASSVTAYMKFAEQPTETSYDEVVNLSEENQLNSMEADCESRGICFYSILINCNFSGKYYVGLLENQTRTELSYSRGRRSILSEGAKQEKCVKFKDPPPTVATPVESIILVPKYYPEKSVNYSLQVDTIWCAFWSDTEQRWTNKGCKVRTKVVIREDMK